MIIESNSVKIFKEISRKRMWTTMQKKENRGIPYRNKETDWDVSDHIFVSTKADDSHRKDFVQKLRLGSLVCADEMRKRIPSSNGKWKHYLNNVYPDNKCLYCSEVEDKYHIHTCREHKPEREHVTKKMLKKINDSTHINVPDFPWWFDTGQEYKASIVPDSIVDKMLRYNKKYGNRLYVPTLLVNVLQTYQISNPRKLAKELKGYSIRIYTENL